jgi:hypothetical protein
LTNPMKKSDSLVATSTLEFELCSEKKSRGTTSQICSPSLTLATNICTSATLMPVTALNEEKKSPKSQICSPSSTIATNLCTSPTLMPVTGLIEEKSSKAVLNDENNSKTVNNTTTSTYNHEVEVTKTDAMNKLSDDLSEIS